MATQPLSSSSRSSSPPLVDPPAPQAAPPPNGTPLVLTSAGDVETLVRANGTRFLVTNRNGDITPAGSRELGLFADDTRYVSHYELSVADLNLVYLSSNTFDPSCNRIDLMVSGLGNDEFLDDPQNFLHIRRRQLVDEVFREQIELVNYLQRRVDLEITLRFAADFADVFEIRGAKRVRRGLQRTPVVREAAVEIAYDGLDNNLYSTLLTFNPEPDLLTSDRAAFRLSVEPGRSHTIEVIIAPAAATGRIRPGVDFDERIRAEHEAADRFRESSTRYHCDNAIIEHVLEQSTADLRALAISMRGHRVLAAGIPWFCCPFGRDTLIAAYEALTLNPDLAASSLRALAAFQGKKHDVFTEEEPGKIFHELRFGEMSATNEIPHSPYYGSIDATPLFVVVANAAYKVTGDRSLLGDLEGAIRGALGWIDARSQEGKALVTYERQSERGLDNQGWKDSRAGVSFPDGRRAKPPIALCEVQGYCVDAYRRGASLLHALGDDEGAARYDERARTMATTVERRMWLEDLGRYAFAIDGEGKALPTVVSNIGHLLWSRVPSDAHAKQCAALLTAQESLSGFGVRTLAAGQAVYNPLSYHNGTVWPHDNALIAKGFANYDLMDQACMIFESMVSAMGHFANRRLPELYCGMAKEGTLVRYPVACSPQAWAAAAPFLLVQAVLGIHIDGVNQRLFIRNPKMPRSMSRIEIEGLRVGKSRVSLRLHRRGARCHVDRLDVTGEPLRTLVEIE